MRREPTIPGLDIRAFDPERDFEAGAAFLRDVDRHDAWDWLPSATDLASLWTPSERFDPMRDAVVARVGDEVVGLATTDWRAHDTFVSHEVSVWVRPARRRRGLGRRLLAWAEARARDVRRAKPGENGLPHVLDAYLAVEVAGVETFAEAAGYSPHTYGFLMLRQLAEPIPAAPLPEGLEIRPVQLSDHRLIWDADTEAFRDHAEPSERDEADFEHWFSQPGLDTSLWRVAWAGDEVAGSVMAMIWAEENAALGVRRAWLEHVSVRRPWRRMGLASALIAESLRVLRERGLDQAILGVHGENPTGAVGLYERLGFHVHRRWQLWRKPIDAV